MPWYSSDRGPVQLARTLGGIADDVQRVRRAWHWDSPRPHTWPVRGAVVPAPAPVPPGTAGVAVPEVAVVVPAADDLEEPDQTDSPDQKTEHGILSFQHRGRRCARPVSRESLRLGISS